ncbi:MAG: GntR family transcriptional regulator [Sulfitobacter sp.]
MPPETKSKSDRLFDQLRSDILSLDLAPDAPLRLPALAERYGIGLTPLRECLNRLASEKLVVPVHNKGFHVAPVTVHDLLDLERTRNAIEGSMFAFSVIHGDDPWEAGVIGSYHQLSNTPVPSGLDSADELALWTKRHEAFHEALTAGSPSIWMHRYAGQIGDQLGRYQRFIQIGLRELAATDKGVAQNAAKVSAIAMALAPHTALYDAALARDPQAATSAFDAHGELTISAFAELATMMPAGTPLATGPNTDGSAAHDHV